MLITQVIWVSLAYVNNTGYLGVSLAWRMLITQVIWVSLAYVNLWRMLITQVIWVSLAYVNNTYRLSGCLSGVC